MTDPEFYSGIPPERAEGPPVATPAAFGTVLKTVPISTYGMDGRRKVVGRMDISIQHDAIGTTISVRGNITDRDIVDAVIEEPDEIGGFAVVKDPREIRRA